MAQMTWRASEELVERVRSVATESGRSMNEYVTSVLEAATDPRLASDDVARLRERLARAGILAPPGAAPRRRPSRQALAKARAAAGRGRSLSQIVADER